MATKRSRANGAPQESRNENQHGNLSLEKKGCRSLMQKYGTLLECPRELWIIYFLKFLESFSYYTLAVTMTLYLSQEFGYSDTASGTAYGMMGMLTSIYGFLVGFIIDNLGVKNSLACGFGLLLAGRTIYATTQSVVALDFMILAVLPLGSALGVPVMTIGIRRYTRSPEELTNAYALFYTSMNLAAVVAAPTIDAFRHALLKINSHSPGKGYMLEPYRLLVVCGCFFTAIAFCVTAFAMRGGIQAIDAGIGEKKEKSSKVGNFKLKKASPWTILREVTSQVAFWRFLLFVSCFPASGRRTGTWKLLFQNTSQRMMGEDASYGMVMAINPLVVILLVPFLSPLLEKYDSSR